MSDVAIRIPGRGYLRLHGHVIDDSEGKKTIVRRWYVSASTVSGEPATSKEEAASRYHGIITKGWCRIGPSPWGRHLAAEVAVGGDDSMVQLSVNASVLGSLAVGVAVPRPWIDRWVFHRRVIVGLKVGYLGHVVAELWHDDQAGDMQDYYRDRPDRLHERRGRMCPTPGALVGGWQWETPRPRIVDRVFGTQQHTLVEGDPITVPFNMPGSDTVFEAVVKRENRTWKRPRAWWHTEHDAWDVEVAKPPQFAGKGENSWDCGDDGIYGMSVKARTPEEAVVGYVKAVMEATTKRGPASDGARR